MPLGTQNAILARASPYSRNLPYFKLVGSVLARNLPYFKLAQSAIFQVLLSPYRRNLPYFKLPYFKPQKLAVKSGASRISHPPSALFEFGLHLDGFSVSGAPLALAHGESSHEGIEPGFFQNSSIQRELTCHLSCPIGFCEILMPGS
nr:hypothetical protein Iba_chr06bCG2200 [Ipomoea batatas]